MLIVGSPAYLARAGRPARPDDLRSHACVRFRRSNGALALWQLNDNSRSIEVAVTGPLIAHDFVTMLTATLENMGLAQLPEPLVREHLSAGRLVSVLEGYVPTAPGMFLYHPGRRQVLPKLRAFIDHVKSRSDAARRTRVEADDRRRAPRKRS
jgi:DNA-binding transcriptional LysR family regulator